MGFNISTLSKSNYEMPKVVSSESYNSNIYFISALESSLLFKEEMSNITNELYKSLSESTTEQLVTEAFDNYFKSIAEMIDKFIKHLDKLCADFKLALISRMSKDKFILARKELFLNYPQDKKFFVDRYKFTNLSSGIPRTEIIMISYEEELAKINNIIGDKNMSIADKITNLMYLYNSFLGDLNSNFYDRFRGALLRQEGNEISKADFSNELFNVFRNGGNKLPNSVNHKEVKSAYERLSDAKNINNDLQKEKKNIEKQYTILKADINNIKFENLMPTFGPGFLELETKFDTYMKAKVDQILNMCDIHMMAFTAKLDAISCSYLQDRTVLLTAMNRVEVNE